MTALRALRPLLLFIAFAVAPSRSDAGSEGIAFLHLRLHAAKAELLDVTIAPGRLKRGPEHSGDRILLQVRSGAGDLLWEGTIEDPQVQVLESGEDEHGRRARKVVEHASREVTARVPFLEEGQEVRVLRIAPSKDASAHQKLLGAFRLGK